MEIKLLILSALITVIAVFSRSTSPAGETERQNAPAQWLLSAAATVPPNCTQR